ncbi:NepR family anti-sigma factor [Vannielia litorea]|uniref:NepR family anti-sigma factor n=1 Tax=Vannielia litorea TaxID=1217970 RepID=UPI0031405AD2
MGTWRWSGSVLMKGKKVAMKEQQKEATDGLRRQIDENLRRVFQAQVEEDVPDRFTDLINRLRQQDTEGDSSK